MRARVLFTVIALFSFSTLASANSSEKEIKALIEHFDKKGKDIKPLLEDTRFELIENITGKFKRAVEIKIEGIDDYKRVINFDRKKDKSAEFMKTYSAELDKAEKEYGIPKTVIVGIIGVESEFGKYRGSYNPFNAYVSMYVEGYRKKWALAQLEELLEFAENHKLDIMAMESSYAGAMSYAQFIPWSLNRWFVGGDLYDMPNNIYSVANYLAHYKEVTGSLEKSILRYNPSSMYQQAVLALAEEAEVHVDSGE